MGRYDDDDDDDFDDEEEEIEQILFQGAVNGKDANLKKNAKLARAGLVPAKQIVSDAVDRRAHDLMIEPKGPKAAVRLMVDGVGYGAGAIPGKRALAVIQMLKLLAGLDIEQRRQKQVGGIKAEFRETPYELTVESVPVKPGIERLRIRVENLNNRLLKPNDVGLTDDFKTKFREMMQQQSGLVVVCGPPGSGTTTTSYCLAHTIDSYLYSVFSLADVGTRDLTNITQFEPEEGHDLEINFDRMIRKEANVVFLDPLDDAETAKTIFEYRDKIAVLCEIEAPNPAAAIQKLLGWADDPELVASTLKGVVTQKLIRKLCDDCKQAFRPNPKMLRKIGLPKTVKVLYREPTVDEEDPDAPSIEEMCEDCDGMPYYGRVAMYEMLEVTDGVKDVIRNGADAAALKRQMEEEDMQTLQKDGLRLVAEGVTSLEELKRAFAPPRPKRRPQRRRRPQ